MIDQVIHLFFSLFFQPRTLIFQRLPNIDNKAEGNQALQDFLMSCNTKKQQSTSLESYLIKPIQRILKYPLLLQQLKNATVANSEEQQHLFDALIGMERVAEHINEMQRIHEEYGAIFDHLFRQHQKASKSVSFYPSKNKTKSLVKLSHK